MKEKLLQLIELYEELFQYAEFSKKDLKVLRKKADKIREIKERLR